jgi:hypothetical protein
LFRKRSEGVFASLRTDLVTDAEKILAVPTDPRRLRYDFVATDRWLSYEYDRFDRLDMVSSISLRAAEIFDLISCYREFALEYATTSASCFYRASEDATERATEGAASDYAALISVAASSTGSSS